VEYDASLFDESLFANTTEVDWTLIDSIAGGTSLPSSPFTEPESFDCVLAAGDASDLPGLRTWCAALPEDSYGQVFVEVFSPIQTEELQAPPGINVTWIYRERLRETTRPGLGIPRCQALADAVDAWLDEWYRAEHGAERHFTIWMGARSSSIMRSYWNRVEAEVAEAWSQRD
jgi:NADPH-dependent ferric siderophore reductase